MIDIAKLTDEDVGREVKYHRPYCDPEWGKITSWNDNFVFVNYHTRLRDGVLSHMTGSTSQGTEACDLVFGMGGQK